MFLVDTGSDRTLLHPKDFGKFSDQGRAFRQRLKKEAVPDAALGVGGHGLYYWTTATLTFTDSANHSHEVPIKIRIAKETRRNRDLDSAVGIDVIGRWPLNYNRAASLVTFEASTS